MPQLTNLDVEWVSLVDRAAVRDPVEQSEPMRFLIWKRETDPSQGGHHMSKLTKEIVDSLGDPIAKESDLATLVEKADDSDQAALALTGAARLLATVKSDLSDTAVAELAKAAGVDLRIEKAGPKFGTPEWDEKYGVGAKKKPEPKDAAELIESLKKSDMDSALVSQVEDALAKAAEADDLAKADPATRARVEKAEKEAAEAKQIAKEERDARLTKEYVAKAEKLKHLAIKAEDFGPVLREAAEKLSKDAYESLETLLKASNEQIEKGELFAEAGAAGSTVAKGVIDEIQQKAEDIKKAEPKLSDAEAFDKAMQANPELEAAYLAEQRAA